MQDWKKRCKILVSIKINFVLINYTRNYLTIPFTQGTVNTHYNQHVTNTTNEEKNLNSTQGKRREYRILDQIVCSYEYFSTGRKSFNFSARVEPMINILRKLQKEYLSAITQTTLMLQKLDV